MTENKAKTIVVVSVGAAGIFSVLEYLGRRERPPLTVFLGAGIAGALLLGLAEFAPSLAGAFGLLVLIGALLRGGSGAFLTITNALK